MPKMTKEELVDLLISKNWEWSYHKEQGMDGLAFRKEFNGKMIKYHLSNDGIKQASVEGIEKRIKSHDVYHMSRVVGYFARIGNWNNSKLGELKDRRKGIYTI